MRTLAFPGGNNAHAAYAMLFGFKYARARLPIRARVFLCLSHPLGEMRESPLTIGCRFRGLGFFVFDVPSPRPRYRPGLGLDYKYSCLCYAYLIGNTLAR